MKKAAALCYVLLMASPLLANPKGGVIKGGKGSIKSHGPLVEVTASDRATIHWHEFSIDKGETTRFIQPSSSSVVVNKVTGSMPSTIAGRLEANGKVALINPQGVVVTQDGVIKTSGFIASTADLMTDAQGEFILGGRDFLQSLDPMAAINLDGIIDAQGGEVTALAGSVTVSGTIKSSSGAVKILGDHAHVTSSAHIDTCGQNSAGSVIIGGDALRQDTQLYAAKNTTVERGATIDASCIENGDAGKIIIWADDRSQAFGLLKAEGGKEGGKGGFIEVSGGLIDIAGLKVSTLAKDPQDTGTLLLDPYNITISSGSTSNISGTSNFFATGNSANLAYADINTALASNNVTISTGTSGTQAGNITLEAPSSFGPAISWRTSKSLSLTAAGTIELQAGGSIICTEGGSITLDANKVIIRDGAAISTSSSGSAPADILIKTNQAIPGSFTFEENMPGSAGISNSTTGGKIGIYVSATGNTFLGKIYSDTIYSSSDRAYYRSGLYKASDVFPGGSGIPFTIFVPISANIFNPTVNTYTTPTVIANQETITDQGGTTTTPPTTLTTYTKFTPTKGLTADNFGDFFNILPIPKSEIDSPHPETCIIFWGLMHGDAIDRYTHTVSPRNYLVNRTDLRFWVLGTYASVRIRLQNGSRQEVTDDLPYLFDFFKENIAISPQNANIAYTIARAYGYVN